MGLMRMSAVMASGAALIARPALAASESAAKGGMPQLNFESWGSQIFWLAVSMIVLFLLLKNIALPRIATALEERSEKIEDDLDRASAFRRQAEQSEAAYDKALADARGKAQEIAKAAKDAVQADVAVAVAKADAEIAARAAEGEARIAAIRDNALEAVAAVAADTVGAVIDSVAPGLGDDAAGRAAVAEILGR